MQTVDSVLDHDLYRYNVMQYGYASHFIIQLSKLPHLITNHKSRHVFVMNEKKNCQHDRMHKYA